VPNLNANLVERLSTILNLKEGVYNLADKYSNDLNSELFKGVLPDYKNIYLKPSDLSDEEINYLISDSILQCLRRVHGLNLNVAWIQLYKTYGRKRESLRSGGRYTSFDWHFDNPGHTSVAKIMYLLTDCNSVENGAFEFQPGKRNKTLIAGLGNSRLPFFKPDKNKIEFIGKAGEGMLFDPACTHRGGLTYGENRDVVVIELAPCGQDIVRLPGDVWPAKYHR
jgi:hypothetical protein